MPNILFILSRVFAGIVGAFFLCCAFFLYEDAEKRIQNRLEEIWVRIDDLQSSAMSKEVAFLQGATRTTSAILDRLLGHKLLSWQAIAVSMEFSLASFFIWAAIFLGGLDARARGGLDARARAFLVFWALFLFVVGSLSAFANRSTFHILRTILDSKTYYLGLILLTSWLTYSVILPPIFQIGRSALSLRTVSLFGFVLSLQRVDVVEIEFFYQAVLPGIFTDIFFIAFFRWILKRVAGLSQLWTIALYLVVVSMMAALLVAPAIALGTNSYGLFGVFYKSSLPLGVKHFITSVAMVSMTNLVDGLCLLLLIVVMLLLLAHRLIWPLIERPIYSASRRQLIKNSKLLFTSGTLLLLYAVPNYSVVKWLTHF